MLDCVAPAPPFPPQAQLLMVQEGLVPRLTGAWVQHRTAPGAAVGALKCAVSLGACTEFLAQLDARLAAQYLLEIMMVRVGMLCTEGLSLHTVCCVQCTGCAVLLDQ